MEKDDTIGRWSLEKLDLLRKYLQAYVTVLKKQGFIKGYEYIDGFAGHRKTENPRRTTLCRRFSAGGIGSINAVHQVPLHRDLGLENRENGGDEAGLPGPQRSRSIPGTATKCCAAGSSPACLMPATKERSRFSIPSVCRWSGIRSRRLRARKLSRYSSTSL